MLLLLLTLLLFISGNTGLPEGGEISDQLTTSFTMVTD